MTTICSRRGRAGLLGLLLLLALAGQAQAAGTQEETPRSITWIGYNEALSLGRDFDKPVFIHFTAPWCKWCRKMQEDTYTDPRVVRYLTENYAAVMVDTEKLPTLARKYGVESLPTLWFLDSQGKALTNIQGYAGADKLLRVLEYIATKAYEEVDYKTWMRKHPAH